MTKSKSVALTHDDLVQRGVQWLKSKDCNPVFAEYVTQTLIELPDVIGFGPFFRSVVVEAKVTRSDFKKDATKPHRQLGGGMGQKRWYLTPPGLLEPKDLPDDWGLAEVYPKCVRVIREAVDRAGSYDYQSERAVLASALRRHALGIPFDEKTGKFAPVSSRKDNTLKCRGNVITPHFGCAGNKA